MEKLEKKGPENIVFKGNIFEINHQIMKSSTKEIIFEKARRSPGVRLIIRKDNLFLLSREFRYETNEYEYRLPGGKVFDSLEEYHSVLKKNVTIESSAQKAAIKECLEEVGIEVKSLHLFRVSKAGSTIEWDLFYFIVEEFKESTQNLEEGEIILPEWKTIGEIKNLISQNQFKEDRSIGVLIQYLLKEKLL